MDDNQNRGKKRIVAGMVFFIAAVFVFFFWIGWLTDHEGIYLAVAIFAGFAAIAALRVFILSFRASPALKELRARRAQMKGYRAYPFASCVDYKKELAIMREKFHADTRPNKNVPLLVKRYSNATNCYDYSVVAKGEVYYGVIVQANEELFRENQREMDSGAVILYSTDEYYESHPFELRKIAEKIYAGKRFNILRNEWSFYSNLKLNPTLTDGRTVYMTTLIVYRLYLPTGYLSDAMFPIVAAPHASSTTLVLDSTYWSDIAIGNFVHGVFLRQGEKPLSDEN